MPCEGCHVQFTVFKRKRSCYDCKRYYCLNCLDTSNNRKHVLCERCLLFSKRPLARADLVKLKVKDLIFYLQSKHISTAGCVEKEELIDLVLQYVDRTAMNYQASSSGGGSGTSSGGSSKNTTPQHQPQPQANVHEGVGGGGARRSTDYGTNSNNSFDSIKQTCQNFFSNLSDNISDSLSNFEGRTCSKQPRPERPATTRTPANVTEQPRVTTRELPTYASSQQNTGESSIRSPTRTHLERDQTEIIENLVVNLPPSDEQQVSSSREVHEECNCSDDDELIASFSSRTRSPKSQTELKIPLNMDQEQDQATTTCAPSTSTSTSKPSSQNSKLEIYINDEEESSHSSFEELGAIGGISDDSKTTTTDTTSNTTDHWQMLDIRITNNEQEPLSPLTPNPQEPHDDQNDGKSPSANYNDAPDHHYAHNNHENSQPFLPHPPPLPTPTHKHPAAPARVKKVTRRRSESYLNRRRPQTSLDDDEDEASTSAPASRSPLQNLHNLIEEETQTSTSSAARNPNSSKHCCARCGKNKANIRQQVEKMRRHLESSQMSEMDIKLELSEFLAYLERRTKSVEYSDSEAGISTPSAGRHAAEIEEEDEYDVEQIVIQAGYQRSFDINGDQTEAATTIIYDKDSRFINLDDIESLQQLECLTVKQLKEILMLHRVDYKGCCEKQELLDRVKRLWKNLKSTPAVEKLPTDELCKICMDAPIECVILECGHMATCTNCGKVLSECPICRQYIVRVVRFFRA